MRHMQRLSDSRQAFQRCVVLIHNQRSADTRQQTREQSPAHLGCCAVLWRIDQHQQAACLVGIAQTQGAVDGCCSGARRPAAATVQSGQVRDAQHTTLGQALRLQQVPTAATLHAHQQRLGVNASTLKCWRLPRLTCLAPWQCRVRSSCCHQPWMCAGHQGPTAQSPAQVSAAATHVL